MLDGVQTWAAVVDVAMLTALTVLLLFAAAPAHASTGVVDKGVPLTGYSPASRVSPRELPATLCANGRTLRYRIVERRSHYVVAKRAHTRVAVGRGWAHLVGDMTVQFREARRTRTAVYLRRVHKPKPKPTPSPTPTPKPTPTPTPAIALEKGVSFTAHSAGAYDNVGVHAALDELRGTGATWVMFLATVCQDSIDSTTIAPAAQTPSDASLRDIIAYAHSIGLKVMLKPHVDFTSDPDHSRSQIGPEFSNADWAAWFASYEEMIVHYAKLAADTHCEQFSVGCELDSTVSDEAAWRRVIADVRVVYPGLLTYAADLYTDSPTDVLNVQWWDAVDLIGVEMYPTLSDQLEPSVADLVAGWQPIYDILATLHSHWNKPIIFTEIGVRGTVGAAEAPWDWQASGAVDLLVQADWYQAALQTLAAHSFMAGMFWWEWAPWPSVGGSSDTSYTPHGKPAEVILTDWFTNKLL